MRKYFLIFFILIIQVANAQFKDGLLHLRTGMSIPLFDYASYDLDDGCFTMTGFSTSVGFSSKVYKNWGLEVQGGFQLHPVEVAILGYYKVQDDPFLLDVTIRSEPYRVIHFVGGPNYSFSTKKWNYTFEVLAGFFYSSTPYQLYKPTYFMVGPRVYEITSSSDYSFAYGGGFNVSYSITDVYNIGFESEILSSMAAFNFNTSNGIRTDFRQITMLNLSLSLALKIPYGHK